MLRTLSLFAIASVLLSFQQVRAETWWSLRPLQDVSPPEVAEAPAAWQDHPVDRFIFARLADRGLMANPPAKKRELIRRLTYDLTGLAPTPEEVANFLEDDSPDAYEQLVDRLLASSHYGEHWGRHWLDVVRFGESNGFERNVLINNLWPFRDYVIRSFNEDKPFDRLVREHLAADTIAPDDPQVAIGTAFLVSGPYDNVGNQDAVQAAQIRANTIDEMIRASSGAFLGLTIGCARCHDHKFDPISQKDYYRLYATFAGVHHGSRTIAGEQERKQRNKRLAPLESRRERLQDEIAAIETRIEQRGDAHAAQLAGTWTRPPIDRRGTVESFTPVTARHLRLIVEGQENNPGANSGYRIDEFEVWTAGMDASNVALSENGGRATGSSRQADDFSAAYSADLTNDGRIGARWIASGPELIITFAAPYEINRIVFSSDRDGAAGDHAIANFVSEYRIEVSLDGKKWQQVADSYDREPINDAHRRHRLREWTIGLDEREELGELRSELAHVNHQIDSVPQPPEWWIGNFSAAGGPFHVFRGGNPQRKGAEVAAEILDVLSHTAPSYELPHDSSEADRRRQLAEWIVSKENPLTPRVLANRLWHYHFGTGIVDTPSDFGSMGSRPTHPQLLDWLARQVHLHEWRLKPLHRLIVTSQTYRQSADYRKEAAQVDADSRLLWRFPPRRLSAEEIRDTMLMIAGKLEDSGGGPGFRLYRYLEDNVATYVPLAEHSPETYRRSVYHQNARAAAVDLLSEFDLPDCAFPTPRRASTTSPLQALTLLNHSFTLDMAEFLANRLRTEAPNDLKAQITRSYQLAYAREPSETELQQATAFIESQSLTAYCRVLLNSNELVYVD